LLGFKNKAPYWGFILYGEVEESIAGMIKPIELIAMIDEEELKEMALNIEEKSIGVIESLKT
jgi:hypothetical protein